MTNDVELTGRTEDEIEHQLMDLLAEAGDVRSFEDAGLLTHHRGIVIRTADAEYQLTIVRSRLL